MPKIPHILVGRHWSELVERRVLGCSRHYGWNRVVVGSAHPRQRASHRSFRKLDSERVGVAAYPADLRAANAGLCCDRQDPLRSRTGENDSALTFAKQDCPVWEISPVGEIDLRPTMRLGVGDTAFCQRDGDTSVAAVVCGPHRTRTNRIEQNINDGFLALHIAAGWGTKYGPVNCGEILT